MSDKSNIEWTEATWNPTTGCDRISPGCAHCYAKAIHDRRHKAHLAGKTMPVQFHQPFEVVQTRYDRAEVPLHWRQPRRVFVDSMSDLFHDDVSVDYIARVFAVMALAYWHDFQVLTKRAERMRAIVTDLDFREQVEVWIAMTLEDEDRPPVLRWDALDRRRDDARATAPDVAGDDWPLPNVRLGPSIENQHFADMRFPIACELGEAGWNTMVSLEPLLGPVRVPARYLALGSRAWCIPGGESGNGARPCHVVWVGNIVADCHDAIACFVKQLGAVPLVTACRQRHFEWGEGKFAWWQNDRSGFWRVKLEDRKGGDPSEWPEYLRVRQFPVPSDRELSTAEASAALSDFLRGRT